MFTLWFAIEYFLPFVILLSFIIFVHEMGHYWVARCFKMDIESFSMGFGRELFGWTDARNTRWKISVLPVGGYVKLRHGLLRYADHPIPANDTTNQKLFIHSSLGARMAVILAGPISNLMLGIWVFSLMFAFIGKTQMSAHIDEVFPGSPAETGGLKAGDTVLSINRHLITTFGEITEFVWLHPGDPLHIIVDRNGNDTALTIIPDVINKSDPSDPTKHLVRIGARHYGPVQPQPLPPLQALSAGVHKTLWMIEGTILAPGQILKGARPPEKVAGISTEAGVAYNALHKSGWLGLVSLGAVFSINLGLFNLIPFPPLDGGHLVFCAIEAIIHKSLNKAVIIYSSLTGLATIIILFILTNWADR